MLVCVVFHPGVMVVWFFDVCYHFEDVIFNLPYVLFDLCPF